MVPTGGASVPPEARSDERVGTDGAAPGAPAERGSLAFERLGAIAALLDARAEIIATNEAWRLFAFLNDGPARGVRDNYLDVCDRAAKTGDAMAATVADGIRRVLAGACDHFEVEYPCPSPTEDRWFLLHVASAPAGEGGGAVVSHVDISSSRMRELAGVDAERDELTGLANLRAGHRLLGAALDRAVLDDTSLRILLLDLDSFEAVNSRHGRRVGDEVLARVAARIRRAVRASDLVCRVGGDEYLIVCPDLDPAGAEALVERLRTVVAVPVQVGAAEVRVSASIGIADSRASTSAEGVLASADAEMFADKDRRQSQAAAGRSFWSRPAPSGPDGLGASDDRSPHPYRAVIDALGEGLIVQDATGHVRFANSEARRLLGLERISPTAVPHGATLVDAEGHPIDPDQMPGRSALRTRAPVRDATIGVRYDDGETRWLEVSAHPVTSTGRSEPHAVASSVRDVTAQRVATEQLRMQARLLDSVGQAVVAWDRKGMITYLNRAATELYGWATSSVVGTSVVAATSPAMDPAQLLEAEEAVLGGWSWEGEITVGRLDGSRRPVWTANTPVYDGEEVIGAIGISVDISERKAAEAALVHQASHDVLTGLLNRQALIELIDADRTTDHEPAPGRAVVLVSLGALEAVSDAFGHDLGEQAVLRCAHVLRRSIHPGDVTARYSDHSFAVWCPHVGSTAEGVALAERLRSLLDRPLHVDGIDVRLGVSAAVARRNGEPVDAAEVLRRAATALAIARRDRSTQIYDRSMGEDLVRQVEVQSLVEGAIAAGSVGLAYQPIVRLDDEQTVGAEALLRLVGLGGEPIPPAEAIEAAERSGHIGELGDLILRTACAAAVRWRQAAPERTIPVSVNLSARQLDDPKLPARVAAVLTATGLDPSALCLEVTESSIMTDPVRSAAILTDLKAQGIRLSADDFGTGYSSLAHLKSFPLDELKIDRSFVAGLPDKAEDVAIVGAILAMAGALGLSVVSEGVETRAHLSGLRSLGADRGQGFLWSRARSAPEFEAWLAADVGRRVASSSPPPGRTGLSNQTALAAVSVAAGGTASEERIDSVLEVLAHELRGPLTVVSGYASLLGEEGTTTTAEIRESIERAVVRMDEMLTSMVEVADIDDAAALGGVEATEAGAFVDSVVGDLVVARPGRIHSVIPSATRLWIDADVTQLGQALGNLVRNADRHAPPNTPIEIETAAAGDWIEITVSDRGPGVSSDHLGLVFRKYGRVGIGAGTGLGLFVARRIARSHGGDVLYRRRQPGPGASFCLRIPRIHPS